ncbi:MAG: ABC transporter ATP-binding protein [Clostridia bacterium]|nr:ABC transporter ATP-binding protein [Clostridia bacterium]
MAERNNSPLSIRGLCKYYEGFHLEDVTFSLEKGTITGFIGRNGAGKTTTLNAVLSFIAPTKGQVRFFGLDMASHAEEIKQKTGFVSAGMTYYTMKKLKTITKVNASFYPQWDDRAYRRYMTRFGLDGNKTPAALSNGMKIKYALALALSHGAELLILDEPTSGLDPVSREELIEIFLSLRDEGKTILFSTHITSDLEKCADRMIFLRRGQIAADRPYRDFAADYRIAECVGEVPADIQEKSLGACRTRDGATVLLRGVDAPAGSRVPTLDEIMIHLEKEEGQ